VFVSVSGQLVDEFFEILFKMLVGELIMISGSELMVVICSELMVVILFKGKVIKNGLQTTILFNKLITRSIVLILEHMFYLVTVSIEIVQILFEFLDRKNRVTLG